MWNLAKTPKCVLTSIHERGKVCCTSTEPRGLHENHLYGITAFSLKGNEIIAPHFVTEVAYSSKDLRDMVACFARAQ